MVGTHNHGTQQMSDTLTPSDAANEELASLYDLERAQNAALHAHVRRYRLALNLIAHPKTWRIREGFHVEIATRALLIGGEHDDLIPEEAKTATP